MVAGHPLSVSCCHNQVGAMTEDDAGCYITMEDALSHHSRKDEVPGDGGSGSCRLESVCSLSGGEGGKTDKGEQKWNV